jgi:hypothetical protein
MCRRLRDQDDEKQIHRSQLASGASRHEAHEDKNPEVQDRTASYKLQQRCIDREDIDPVSWQEFRGQGRPLNASGFTTTGQNLVRMSIYSIEWAETEPHIDLKQRCCTVTTSGASSLRWPES